MLPIWERDVILVYFFFFCIAAQQATLDLHALSHQRYEANRVYGYVGDIDFLVLHSNMHPSIGFAWAQSAAGKEPSAPGP